MNGKFNIEHYNKLERHFDDFADAYAVLGERKADASPSLKRYVVYWQARHDPCLICKPSFVSDIESARKRIRDYLKNHDIQNEAGFFSDHQQQKVYDWENENILPAGVPITKNQAIQLIKTVCRDYGVKTPSLRWMSHTEHSEWDYDEYEINFGARDNISLLHELAHVIIDDLTDNSILPNHPPAFVWQAMALYSSYAGLDHEKMEKQAVTLGLVIVPEEEQPVARRKPDDRKYTCR